MPALDSQTGGKSVSDAIEIARMKSNKPREALGLGYWKALQQCLDWREDLRAKVYQDKVLDPLRELKGKYGLPSTEIW